LDEPPYCTVTVKLACCVTVPPVAVKLTVYVPTHDDAVNQFALSKLNLSVSLKQLSLRRVAARLREIRSLSGFTTGLKQDRKKSRQDDRDANQARHRAGVSGAIYKKSVSRLPPQRFIAERS
jgi:hypothetical protein